MKKLNIPFLAFFGLLLILFSSCEKEPITPEPNMLVGTWVMDTLFINIETSFLDSTPNEYEQRIYNGYEKWEFHENGKCNIEMGFGLEEYSYTSNNDSLFIHNDSNNFSMRFSLNGNKLMLIDKFDWTLFDSVAIGNQTWEYKKNLYKN